MCEYKAVNTRMVWTSKHPIPICIGLMYHYECIAPNHWIYGCYVQSKNAQKTTVTWIFTNTNAACMCKAIIFGQHRYVHDNTVDASLACWVWLVQKWDTDINTICENIIIYYHERDKYNPSPMQVMPCYLHQLQAQSGIYNHFSHRPYQVTCDSPS